MVDILARQRQLIGTTADWAADDLVIGAGEVAVEDKGGVAQLKIGDGTSRFSVLPYFTAGTVAWVSITGKPTNFPPTAHNHPIGDITGLTATLTGKADTTAVTALLSGKVDTTQLATTIGATAAGQIPTLDSVGLLPASYVDGATVAGAGSAGKVPFLDSNGRVPASMIPPVSGGMTYVGKFTPATGAEYPGTTGTGDLYAVVGLAAPYTPAGGSLAGQTINNNDELVYTASGAWDLIPGAPFPAVIDSGTY